MEIRSGTTQVPGRGGRKSRTSSCVVRGRSVSLVSASLSTTVPPETPSSVRSVTLSESWGWSRFRYDCNPDVVLGPPRCVDPRRRTRDVGLSEWCTVVRQRAPESVTRRPASSTLDLSRSCVYFSTSGPSCPSRRGNRDKGRDTT